MQNMILHLRYVYGANLFSKLADFGVQSSSLPVEDDKGKGREVTQVNIT